MKPKYTMKELVTKYGYELTKIPKTEITDSQAYYFAVIASLDRSTVILLLNNLDPMSIDATNLPSLEDIINKLIDVYDFPELSQEQIAYGVVNMFIHMLKKV